MLFILLYSLIKLHAFQHFPSIRSTSLVSKEMCCLCIILAVIFTHIPPHKPVASVKAVTSYQMLTEVVVYSKQVQGVKLLKTSSFDLKYKKGNLFVAVDMYKPDSRYTFICRMSAGVKPTK